MTPIHYDSRDYPPASRFEIYRQIMSTRYTVTRLDDAPFEAVLDAWTIGDMILAHSVLPGIRFERDIAKIRSDNSNHYVFFHMVEGHSPIDVDGVPGVLTSGSTVVYDMMRPFWGAGPLHSEFISVSVPRHLIEKTLGSTRSRHGTFITGHMGRLIAEHLTAMVAAMPSLSEQDATLLATNSVQLMASCLAGSEMDEKDQASALSIAIRYEVLRHIDRHLHDPDLGVASICRALDISRSSAYRAFEGTEGIAAYIRGRRLAAAHMMLEHPDERRPIGEVAAAVGYDDATQFSHAYRRAFGHAPRQERHAAVTGAGLSPIEVSSKLNHANFRRWMRDLETHLKRSGS